MPNTGTDAAWHDAQDQHVDAVLDSLNRVFDNPSAVRRVFGLWDGHIRQCHEFNVHATHKRSDAFRLLDVGCGPGELITHLAELYPRAEFVGVDSNTRSIALASRAAGANCSFRNCRFDEIETGGYDFAICSEVFEHVEHYDELLDTLTRVVRPGGHLSFSTPSGWMFRVPHVFALKALLKNPQRYYRLNLTPERHWSEAVRIHPATQPSKVIEMFGARGFRLVARQSSLWYISERGLLYRVLTALERRRGPAAALRFHHALALLNGLMNVVPPLRIFETRAVLLLEKVR